MITLKAQNENLTINTKFSYLNNNFLSGLTDLVVVNSDGFADDDYVLIGEWGSETSEILQVDSINTSTHTITFTTETKWSHSESTKLSVIKYNQVKFYYTEDPIFSALSQVGDTIDIQPDSTATIGYDTENTTGVAPTGYGWFVFYNETTTKGTQNSNPIPYAGFAVNTVKSILDNFFSILNNSELKLISDNDAMAWLNEGYTLMISELNLINKSYSVELDYEVTTTSGLAEYSLPTNFSKIISVWDVSAQEYLSFIQTRDITKYNSDSSNDSKYYIKGGYLGFSPEPTSGKTFKVTYSSNPSELTSYYDTVDLPNGSFYALKDFMMFRAAPKLNKGDGANYFTLFNLSIERLKVTSIKQDANNDSWSIDPSANV